MKRSGVWGSPAATPGQPQFGRNYRRSPASALSTRVEPDRGSHSELATRIRGAHLRSMTLYGQFCPVAMGAEIFAERWTPLILRELLHGELGFNDIHRGVPRISKNLLAQRLESLRGSGIVEQVRHDGVRKHLYRLTAAGRALSPVVEALGTW